MSLRPIAYSHVEPHVTRSAGQFRRLRRRYCDIYEIPPQGLICRAKYHDLLQKKQLCLFTELTGGRDVDRRRAANPCAGVMGYQTWSCWKVYEEALGEFHCPCIGEPCCSYAFSQRFIGFTVKMHKEHQITCGCVTSSLQYQKERTVPASNFLRNIRKDHMPTGSFTGNGDPLVVK